MPSLARASGPAHSVEVEVVVEGMVPVDAVEVVVPVVGDVVVVGRERARRREVYMLGGSFPFIKLY